MRSIILKSSLPLLLFAAVAGSLVVAATPTASSAQEAPHGDQRHLHGIVEARPQDRLVEIAHHLVRVAVGRRVGQRDERQTAAGGVGDLAVLERLGRP